MASVFLIRHGQSANNALPEAQRVSDPGLTEIGVRQAEATSQRLSGEAIDRLFCSPFLRSLETTRPISKQTNAPVRVNAAIFEQGGCYSGYEQVGRRGEPGMGRSELAEKYPGWEIDPSIEDSGWWGRPYESQSAAERAGRHSSNLDPERASSFVGAMRSDHPRRFQGDLAAATYPPAARGSVQRRVMEYWTYRAANAGIARPS